MEKTTTTDPENNKIYILSHYVGGTPFDSHVIGVYKTLEEAKQELIKSINTFLGFDGMYLYKEDIELNEDSWYYDGEDRDFWGGCKIEEQIIK